MSTFDIDDAQELGRPAPPLDLSIDQQVLGRAARRARHADEPVDRAAAAQQRGEGRRPDAGAEAVGALRDAARAVWSELRTGKDISLFRRNLQREYATRVANALVRPSAIDARRCARTAACRRDEAARRARGGAARHGMSAEAKAHIAEMASAARRSAEGAARPPGRLMPPPRRAPPAARAAPHRARRDDRAALDGNVHARAASTTARSPTSAGRSTRTCGRSRRRSTSRSRTRGADFTHRRRAGAGVARGAALQRFYAAAAKPLSVDDIQLGLVEIAHRSAAGDGAGAESPTTARRCCARAAPTCTAARRTRSRT